MSEVLEEDFNCFGDYYIDNFNLFFCGEKVGISKFYINEKQTYHSLFLSFIEIKNIERKKGYGNGFMQQLTKFADIKGLTIILTPSTYFGINHETLIKWYEKFGFKLNDGKNKRNDIIQDMYRVPVIQNKIVYE